MDIVLRFSSLDDQKGRRMHFFSIDEARKEVKDRLGGFEIGSTYAIAHDGIVKVEIVSGELELEDLRS